MTTDIYQCHSCCEWLPHMVFLCRQLFMLFHLLITPIEGTPDLVSWMMSPPLCTVRWPREAVCAQCLMTTPFHLCNSIYCMYTYHNHSAMKGYIYIFNSSDLACWHCRNMDIVRYIDRYNSCLLYSPSLRWTLGISLPFLFKSYFQAAFTP